MTGVTAHIEIHGQPLCELRETDWWPLYEQRLTQQERERWTSSCNLRSLAEATRFKQRLWALAAEERMPHLQVDVYRCACTSCPFVQEATLDG